VHKTDSDETFHSVKLHRMVGLNVRKWGFYDKTVKNFKPFCWWDAFRSVWMTQQNAPSIFFPGRRVRAHLQNPATKCDFPIGYFIFLLTLEKCAILQCSVLSIRSKLPFLFHSVLLFRSCFVSVLFLFRVCFLLCPFIY
jgi:hypothetical protein